MNKRFRITGIAAIALVMSLLITSVFAATASVSISASQIGTVSSSKRPLNSQSITGRVKSDDTSTSTSTMTGELWTHGSVFAYKRDSAAVSAGSSKPLSWGNPNGHTGQFNTKIISNGGHDGRCWASQP